MDPNNVSKGLDTNNGTAGGGEILKFWGNDGSENPYLNDTIIKEFLAMPIVKGIIAALLVVLAVLIVMRIFKVRNPMDKKTISKELDHIANVRKHDESVIKANRLIKAITNLVEASPLSMDKSNIDYWKYNLTRANIRIPGKSRIMKPEEFNAIVRIVELLVAVIGILVGIVTNMIVSVLIIAVAFIFGSTLPLAFIRSSVKKKDLEIVENFADFYLMIHYVLLASASTPISGIMKSYDKTTESEEMHRFVDTCIHYIDTYGEFEATSYIAKEYREIAEVGKLMRLIRQANEGGDVRAELIGFRDELLSAKKYAIEKRMNKLVGKARASFAMLYIVLIQAIISAMAIYFDDLGVMSSLF
jgi:hypothetical protein